MERYQLLLNHDGTNAALAGVATGLLTVVDRRGDFVALKEGGHHYWSARGAPPSYSPGKYRVFRLLGEGSHRATHTHCWAEQILEFPLRATGGSNGA